MSTVQSKLLEQAVHDQPSFPQKGNLSLVMTKSSKLQWSPVISSNLPVVLTVCLQAATTFNEDVFLEGVIAFNQEYLLL